MWHPRQITFLVVAILFIRVEFSFAFQIGDRVQVTSSNGFKIRDAAAGTQIDVVPQGIRGKIIGGPTSKQIGGSGYNYKWWQIVWDGNYKTGWSAEGDASGTFISLVKSALINFQSQPINNVIISFAPINLSGAANGHTSFTSTWDSDTLITIAANTPLADGSTFLRWLKNGNQFSPSSYVSGISILDGDIFTAVYQVPQPPATPTSLSAFAGSSSIGLGWNDNATNETSYVLERQVNGGSWSVLQNSLSANSGSYTDYSVSSGNAYTYRVKSRNAAGDSAYSNLVSATFTGPPDLMPLPYALDGWSSPILVATQTGAKADSSIFYSTDQLYVSGNVTNVGTGSTSSYFTIQLYVDDVLKNISPSSQAVLSNGMGSKFADCLIGPLTAGNHTLRILADSANVIAESDETNNSYSRTITVSQAPAPSITRLTPQIANAIDDYIPAINGKQWIDVYGTNFSYGGSFKVRVLWTGDFIDLSTDQIIAVSSSHFRIYINVSSTPDNWNIIVTSASGQTSNGHNFVVQPYPTGFTLQSPLYSEPSGVPTMQLNWSASSYAESYDVLRNDVVIFSDIASTTHSYTDNSNLVHSQTYTYKIKAKNRVGTFLSNTLSITTPTANMPIVTVTSPLSGNTFQVGSPVIITWTLSGVTTQVKNFNVAILDNGSEDISRNFSGLSGQSYAWIPPSSFIRSNLTVRVQAMNGSGISLATAFSPSFSTVAATTSPIARIDAFDPVSLNKPVTFSGAISVPVLGRPITNYKWVFSDSTVVNGNQPTVTHTFPNGIEGTVALIVTDSTGASGTASVRFPLNGVGNPPQAKNALSKDPVNTATGNFIMNPTLMSVSARGVPFVFQAFYNSKSYDPLVLNSQPGPLGFSWTHNFEISVSPVTVEDEFQTVIIAFGDGHREKYTLKGTNWTAEAGIYNKLIQSADGSFALTSPNQIKSQFDVSGRLISISDRNGSSLTVVWEPVPSDATKSRIARIELPGGIDPNNPRKVLFSYDAASGHLKALTDPINRTVEFTIDAAHDLRAVKNLRGNSTAYTYDDLHQMLTGTDARGHMFVENVYWNRTVTEQYDADRNKTTFEYPFPPGVSNIDFTRIVRFGGIDNETTEDHHNGKLQLVEHIVWIRNPETGNGFIALSQKSEYDPVSGDRTAVIDRNGNRYTFAYTNGNVTKITTPDQGVTLIEYDAFNNPILKTNPLLKQAKWDYNATGNLIAYTFPYDSNNPAQYKRTYTPDAYGQVTFATDANNHTTHAYLNEWGEVWKVEDAEGHTKIFDLDGIGRRTGVTDERGYHTTFNLNNNGGIETTTFPDPNGPTTIKQVFDQNDNPTSIEDQLHRFTYFEFDNQDRQYKVRNQLNQETTTLFDALGRPNGIEDPKHHLSYMVYVLDDRLAWTSDQEGRQHIFLHDSNGNVLAQTDSDGVKMEYVYDAMNRRTRARHYTSSTLFDETLPSYNLLGQVELVEDANSHLNHKRTQYFYNDAGQLIRLLDTENKEFTWAYDFEGNLRSATHPSANGPKTRYQTFTTRNQLATRTDEDGHLEQFIYDAAGNVDHFINADNQTISYLYDFMNRLTTVGYPNGPPVLFSYDAAGQRRLMDDGNGQVEWIYNDLGQIETEFLSFGHQVHFTYDANGNRETITYPWNKKVVYTYDDANSLKTVTDWQNRTISRNYSPGGRVTSITYPNGVNTTVGYDAAGRENDIQHQKAPDAPFIHFGYTFDPLGAVQGPEPRIHPLKPTSFPAATNNYSYDAANQLAAIDGLVVSHDNRGNLRSGKLSPTSTGNDSLTWDYESRLTGFTIGGISGTNLYNGLGQRIQTIKGGTEIKNFIVDGTGSMSQILAEADFNGNVTAYYLYFGGLAARILPDGSVSYYHSDRQGNTLALTDGSGSITDLYQYDEFGVPKGSSGSSSNPFRYLGGFGVYDNGNGTLLARARHYHPDLGRFLSRDALLGTQQSGQSLNRYVYALNDPVGYSDPSGFVSQHAVSPSFYESTKTYLLGFTKDYLIDKLVDKSLESIRRGAISLLIDKSKFAPEVIAKEASKGLIWAQLAYSAGIKPGIAEYYKVYENPSLTNFEAMGDFSAHMAIAAPLSVLELGERWVPKKLDETLKRVISRQAVDVGGASLSDWIEDKAAAIIQHNSLTEWGGDFFYKQGFR